MMIILKKTNQWSVVLALSLSLLTPYTAHGQDFCCHDSYTVVLPQPCCAPVPSKKCIWDNKALYAVGAVLLGAAAGAGAGYAAGHNNKTITNSPDGLHGCRDLKNVSLGLEIELIDINFVSQSESLNQKNPHVHFSFFAVTPEGCTIQGSTVEANIQNGLLMPGEFLSCTDGSAPIIGSPYFEICSILGQILLSPKSCGIYQFGCNIHTSFITDVNIVDTAIIVATNCGKKPVGLITPNIGMEIIDAFGGTILYASNADADEFQFIIGEYNLSNECCVENVCSCE